MANKIFKIKPFFNKCNGQMNFNLGMKDLPPSLRKMVKDRPKNLFIKFKMEEFGLNK